MRYELNAFRSIWYISFLDLKTYYLEAKKLESVESCTWQL